MRKTTLEEALLKMKDEIDECYNDDRPWRSWMNHDCDPHGAREVILSLMPFTKKSREEQSAQPK